MIIYIGHHSHHKVPAERSTQEVEPETTGDLTHLAHRSCIRRLRLWNHARTSAPSAMFLVEVGLDKPVRIIFNFPLLRKEGNGTQTALPKNDLTGTVTGYTVIHDSRMPR